MPGVESRLRKLNSLGLSFSKDDKSEVSDVWSNTSKPQTYKELVPSVCEQHCISRNKCANRAS
nr:hypothetical protein Itr_chr04CG15940 [Ipomoea trifida]